ncbi:MAG: oligosaccharide flippase family protein [Isosphaeraceae bacterium]
MASPTLRKQPRRSRAHRPGVVVRSKNATTAIRADLCPGRRIASNFAFLSLAELVCRATSILVSFSLMRRLGVVGYGRIEFAFNVVFWLVLLVRDSSDVIVARELSRHPRLIKPIVDHVLAIKGVFSLVLFAGLALVGSLTLHHSADWWLLACYGLMLFTTASGLDFVYRGTECMGLLAVSLSLRTFIYAVGVLSWVGDPSRILWVPVCLAVGEATGIGLVWLHYLKNYRVPRPRLGLRVLSVIVRRGRTVCLIQLSQAVISTADLMIVGILDLSSGWELGIYGAPHRMVTALLTFGLIFQQVAFPTLSRLWRQTAQAGRETLDSLVEVLMTVLVPIAIGTTILAEPMVRLLPKDYAGAWLLLALGIWRAPLLILAFLYQTTLIALNREAVGVRSLTLAAVGVGPLVAVMRVYFGLPGAAGAVILLGLGLVLAGYGCLAREGRQPAWHHHLARPLVASVVMAPVCLILERWHVLLAVLGGAVTYSLVMICLGGLGRTRHWRSALRSEPVTTPGS